MYLSEGDSSYDNSVTCTTTSDNNTVCRFTDQPSNVNAEFGLMTVMAIGGGSLMVTGGALVAGACALSTRGSRKERQQAPAYAGARRVRRTSGFVAGDRPAGVPAGTPG